MARYASKTKVTVDRSKAEVEHVLTRYGADQFAYGVDSRQGHPEAVVGFRVKNEAGDYRTIRFVLPLPSRDDFPSTDSRGKARSPRVIDDELEKATRQRWRAMALIVKAKLEAVESGITTLEREWMGYILLPNGRTVADMAVPEIAHAYAKGSAPKLLLGLKNE
jgi:hypothetical protein